MGLFYHLRTILRLMTPRKSISSHSFNGSDCDNFFVRCLCVLNVDRQLAESLAFKSITWFHIRTQVTSVSNVRCTRMFNKTRWNRIGRLHQRYSSVKLTTSNKQQRVLRNVGILVRVCSFFRLYFGRIYIEKIQRNLNWQWVKWIWNTPV